LRTIYHPLQIADNGSGMLVRAACAFFDPLRHKSWKLEEWLQSIKIEMLNLAQGDNEHVYLRVYLPQSVFDRYSRGYGVQGIAQRALIPGNSRRYSRITFFDLRVSEQIPDIQADFEQFTNYVQANWPTMRSY
jgi:hypothetical protein